MQQPRPRLNLGSLRKDMVPKVILDCKETAKPGKYEIWGRKHAQDTHKKVLFPQADSRQTSCKVAFDSSISPKLENMPKRRSAKASDALLEVLRKDRETRLAITSDVGSKNEKAHSKAVLTSNALVSPAFKVLGFFLLPASPLSPHMVYYEFLLPRPTSKTTMACCDVS
jgi:hypothetical protein